VKIDFSGTNRIWMGVRGTEMGRRLRPNVAATLHEQSIGTEMIESKFSSCANVSGQKKPTAPFLIPRLRHLDTVDELKIEDPDKLGLKVLHSKKRRYDETPPTANWNNGESLSNPAVRVKWAVGVMKRAQGYTTNQASKRDYAKTDGGLR